jgi:hypothetical protein
VRPGAATASRRTSHSHSASWQRQARPGNVTGETKQHFRARIPGTI